MDDFRICLFSNVPGPRVVPIDEIAALPVEQRGPAQFDEQYTAFHWIVDGELREMMSFGPLDLIVPQLRPTSQRVAAGLPAMVRTGALDTPLGNFLHFAPGSDERVVVSLLATDHFPESHLNPLPYDGADAQRLYAFVEREREAMTESGTDFAGYPPFTVGRGALVAALEREAESGSLLLADLGRPVRVE
jgi:hypothetical protein